MSRMITEKERLIAKMEQVSGSDFKDFLAGINWTRQEINYMEGDFKGFDYIRIGDSKLMATKYCQFDEKPPFTFLVRTS